MSQPIGIRSIAVSFPSIIRTNDYFRENYPELIATAEQKGLARVFSVPENISETNNLNLWTKEMMPVFVRSFPRYC